MMEKKNTGNSRSAGIPPASRSILYRATCRRDAGAPRLHPWIRPRYIPAAMSDTAPINAGHGFHVLTKPIGPICNLDCRYCFYLEKEKLYPNERQWRMSDEVLEEYIRQYIQDQPMPEINFAWQGGEPTLLGVEFFRKVVGLQQKYAGGRKISNALQTNGTLLDNEWCEFLAAHKFLIGLSIDGPRELHDQYRVDKRQKPTFDAVMRGLELLRKHKVDFNTLTVVNRANSQQPLEVYRFLKEIGSEFLQFIPLVERRASAPFQALGFDFAEPPEPGHPGDPQSLEVYRFLKEIGSEFLQFIPLVERRASAPFQALGFDFAEPPEPRHPGAPPAPAPG